MKITLPDAGPILCFGGPYSNLQATQAMRREADRLGIPASSAICTGDVVAYCANPNETCEEIRDWGCHVIKGNCEEQLAAGAEDCGCGFGDGTQCDLLSAKWYGYADGNLKVDHRNWMSNLAGHLEFDIAGRTARVIHGGVNETAKFIFPSAPSAELTAELYEADADIVIAGHCGIPFTRRVGRRIWFNPGVIGMPANDGTKDGWYGVIDIQDGGVLNFTARRLAYDATSAQSELRAIGSADPYAEALTSGLWPSLDILPDPERLGTGQPLQETTLTLL